MPESIVCQDGTYFSTACQVKAPCGVKTNVTWYWSPENKSNSSFVITDSSSARTRALHLQMDSCANNSVMLYHFYTLTLAGLSSKNVGFYWCQLEIIDEKESNTAVSNLLPSDKCHIGVDDKLPGCEYGKHKDEWKCAQIQATLTDKDSGLMNKDSEAWMFQTQKYPISLSQYENLLLQLLYTIPMERHPQSRCN